MLLHRRSTQAATLAALALACGGDGSTSPATYDPDIPTEWAAAVTNPFFPLASGTVWQYRAETGEGWRPPARRCCPRPGSSPA